MLFLYTYFSQIMTYAVVDDAHTLSACCLDSLEDIQDVLCLESLQLRVEHHKHSTDTTPITASGEVSVATFNPSTMCTS